MKECMHDRLRCVLSAPEAAAAPPPTAAPSAAAGFDTAVLPCHISSQHARRVCFAVPLDCARAKLRVVVFTNCVS